MILSPYISHVPIRNRRTARTEAEHLRWNWEMNLEPGLKIQPGSLLFARVFLRNGNTQPLEEVHIMGGERFVRVHIMSGERPILIRLPALEGGLLPLQLIGVMRDIVEADRRLQHQHHVKAVAADVLHHACDLFGFDYGLVDGLSELLDQVLQSWVHDSLRHGLRPDCQLDIEQ